VVIGGIAASVSYSGLAPGFAGLYQVNALVPMGVMVDDAVTLSISIGGVTSNTVTIAVQ
jgi:minor extracellular serine protease Vpr